MQWNAILNRIVVMPQSAVDATETPNMASNGKGFYARVRHYYFYFYF